MVDEFQAVRSLLTSLNSAVAEDMQTLLTVAENLKISLTNEMERTKQAHKQYDELLTQQREMDRLWSLDKDKIRTQRNEIGMKTSKIQFANKNK